MNIISSLLARSSKRRMYADLLQLDDYLLRDIGLSRAELRTAMRHRPVAQQSAVPLR